MESSSKSYARPFRHPSKIVVPVIVSLMMYTATVSGIVFLALLFATEEKLWGIWFLVALGLVVALGVIRYVSSLGCLCPLCRGPIMRRSRCEMHARARSHLGLSYRASVALDVAFRGWFVCPYCGTAFRMKK